MKEFESDPILVTTNERLRGLGIEAVVFDLDDTLIYTGEIFQKYMGLYVDIVAEQTGLCKIDFRRRLSEMNDSEYSKMGVSPERWRVVVERLAQEYVDESQVIMDNINILMRIYQDEPRLRPGVKSLLMGLRSGGIKVGLVTHANVDWTYRKLEVTGLINHVDTIQIASENGFKTIEHWRRGMEQLGVDGYKCLVVGDNLKGDVIPGVQLGARAMWIPSPWSVYREGEVPFGVVQIEDINGFWDGVEELGRKIGS